MSSKNIQMPDGHREFLNRFIPEGFVNEIPESLYHYTDSAGLHGLLIKNSIWLTSFKFMNDNRELVHGMEILGRKFEEFLNDGDYDADFIQTCRNVWAFVLEEANDPDIKPYIFCLSQKKDHLSQWRGYGDFGRGFCVEFKYNELNTLDQQGIIIGKVQYDERMFEALCADLVQNWLGLCLSDAQVNYNIISSANMRNLALLFMQAAYALCIKFKHVGFHEEEEWRLFTFIHRGSPKLKYRAHRFGVADYHELIIDPLRMVTEVMSGPVGPAASYLKSSLPASIDYTKSPIPFV